MSSSSSSSSLNFMRLRGGLLLDFKTLSLLSGLADLLLSPLLLALDFGCALTLVAERGGLSSFALAFCFGGSSLCSGLCSGFFFGCALAFAAVLPFCSFPPPVGAANMRAFGRDFALATNGLIEKQNAYQIGIAQNLDHLNFSAKLTSSHRLSSLQAFSSLALALPLRCFQSWNRFHYCHYCCCCWSPLVACSSCSLACASWLAASCFQPPVASRCL